MGLDETKANGFLFSVLTASVLTVRSVFESEHVHVHDAGTVIWG